MRDEDPELQQLQALASAWENELGTSCCFTSGELIDRAQIAERAGRIDLIEVLMDVAGERGGVNAQHLGRYLGRQDGKVVGNRKLVGTRDGHAKQKRWQLQSIKKGDARGKTRH